MKAKRYEEALAFWKQSVATVEPSLSAYHPVKVSTRIELGSALAALSRIEEACDTFQQAYTLAQQSPIPEELTERTRARAKEALGACDKKICKDTLHALQDKAPKDKSQTKAPDEFGGRK